MIKIENTVSPSPEQWKSAVLGARNAMNSWSRYDSEIKFENLHNMSGGKFEFGSNDYDLMKRLCKAGTDHRKFMRMLPVYVDITAPLYWWKEFDTYKVGTVANSCSTMHRLTHKPFEMSDFSFERLISNGETYREIEMTPYDAAKLLIDNLNQLRDLYLTTKEKVYWYSMIQLLPSSYNQKRTVMLNYEVLANIYKSRKNHKLDEWHDFCNWIETLPYSELITGNFND